MPMWAWTASVVEEPLQNILLDSHADLANKLTQSLSTIVNQSTYIVDHDTKAIRDFDIKVTGLAVVDTSAHLLAQAGDTSFNQGDLGSQLPMKMRDDLSDKLVGHFNSGLEKLSDNRYALIRRLEAQDGSILGAVIIYHEWRDNLFEQSTLESLVSREIYTYFTLSFVVLLFTLPCGVIIIFWVTRRLKSRMNHLYSTIEQWSSGNLTQRIRIQSLDELGITFQRLNAMAEKLGSLIAQNQQLAEENERQHIATQLHDTVKQQVFANNLLLATCKNQLTESPEDAQQNLAKIIEQNQLIFAQVNQMISTLQKDESLPDLTKAIDDKLATWTGESGIALSHSVSLPQMLTTKVDKLVRQIIAEGLQNIAKHSRATKAQVSIESKGSELRIFVENNNAEEEKITFGQGLSLLSTNVKNLNGTLSINQENNMWSLQVCLPLN